MVSVSVNYIPEPQTLLGISSSTWRNKENQEIITRKVKSQAREENYIIIR